MPVYSIDYLYEALSAYNDCIRSGKRCDLAKKHITEGINYYKPRINTSLNNRKSYCGLIYLRAHSGSWGNKQLWARDIYELNNNCSFYCGY